MRAYENPHFGGLGRKIASWDGNALMNIIAQIAPLVNRQFEQVASVCANQ